MYILSELSTWPPWVKSGWSLDQKDNNCAVLKVFWGLLDAAATELPCRVGWICFFMTSDQRYIPDIPLYTRYIPDIPLLHNVLNETRGASPHVRPDRHKYIESTHKMMILQSPSDPLARLNLLHGHSKSNTTAGSQTSPANFHAQRKHLHLSSPTDRQPRSPVLRGQKALLAERKVEAIYILWSWRTWGEGHRSQEVGFFLVGHTPLGQEQVEAPARYVNSCSCISAVSFNHAKEGSTTSMN